MKMESLKLYCWYSKKAPRLSRQYVLAGDSAFLLYKEPVVCFDPIYKEYYIPPKYKHLKSLIKSVIEQVVEYDVIRPSELATLEIGDVDWRLLDENNLIIIDGDI